MGRTPCCDKTSVKRGPWSPEEDTALRNYVERHGTGGNWIALPQKAGLRRCGKSCRLRWLNYLRPDIKHGGFTEDEDIIICTLYNKIGSRWSAIASQLPGRTDNDVKNYWNTKLKKRMMAAQKAPPPPPPPPLSSPIKTETFNSSDLSMVLDMVNPMDGGFGFNQDASSPGESLINGYIASAASSSIEVENSSNYINWSANDLLLSELVFGSTSESIGGYDSQEKVADMWVSVDTTPEGLLQRTTYSENPY